MRITTDDGVGLAVEVTGTGPGLCSCTASAARRRTSPTTRPRSRTTTPWSSFDHRGHGESDKPDDPLRVLLRPPRRRHARGRRRGRLEPLPAARSLDGRHGRPPDRARPSGPGRGAGTDGHRARSGPGFDRTLMEFGAAVALEQGKDVLKALLDEARAAATRPRTNACSRSGRSYQEFQDRKWDDALGGDVGARWWWRSPGSPTTSPSSHAITLPDARDRGRAGHAVPRVRRSAMADAIPRRRARR